MTRSVTFATLALAVLAATLLIRRPLFARPAAVPLTIRSPTTATLKQITAADGMWDDRFGTSVAISGDIVVIGDELVDVGFSPDRGAAYIFERAAGDPGDWSQVKKLIASDGNDYDHFGSVVAVSEDVAVVGAPDAAVDSQSNQGAVYIFVRNVGRPGNWGLVKKLVASDGAAFDRFGRSVAVNGDVVVVGSPTDDAGSGANFGAACVFARNQGGAADDRFGYAVAISLGTVAIGAVLDDVDANVNQGSAYIDLMSAPAKFHLPLITR